MNYKCMETLFLLDPSSLGDVGGRPNSSWWVFSLGWWRESRVVIPTFGWLKPQALILIPWELQG
jgi:hypothetical protein